MPDHYNYGGNMDADAGKPLSEHIQRWFEAMERRNPGFFENMDNYRFAKLSDSRKLDEYERKYHTGCWR